MKQICTCWIGPQNKAHKCTDMSLIYFKTQAFWSRQVLSANSLQLQSNFCSILLLFLPVLLSSPESNILLSQYEKFWKYTTLLVSLIFLVSFVRTLQKPIFYPKQSVIFVAYFKPKGRFWRNSLQWNYFAALRIMVFFFSDFSRESSFGVDLEGWRRSQDNKNLFQVNKCMFLPGDSCSGFSCTYEWKTWSIFFLPKNFNSYFQGNKTIF